MTSSSEIFIDPFEKDADKKKYPVSKGPEIEIKKKHSQSRRQRFTFIVGDYYWAAITSLKNTRGYKDNHSVVNAALDKVRTRYSIGFETSGILKSQDNGRKRIKETEKKMPFRIDPDIARDIDTIFISNRRRGVTRMFLLEEGLDILLGIDRFDEGEVGTFTELDNGTFQWISKR